jgi:Holliday junction resolvase-like predicted endonuclease
LAAITPKKLAQMKKAAELYTLKHRLANVDLRLMAVATFDEPPQIGEIIQIS